MYNIRKVQHIFVMLCCCCCVNAYILDKVLAGSDSHCACKSCRFCVPHKQQASQLMHSRILHTNNSLLTLHLCSRRYLDLTGNRLHSFGALSELPALHTLLISGNKVTTTSDCQPDDFRCLEILDISFNSVQPSDVAVLGSFPQLRQLDVSGKGVVTLHIPTCVDVHI